MMKGPFPHLLTLLFFFSFFCLIVGGKRKQGKTHIVEHNNKRWEIKTADSGEHKKGKDYQEDYGNGRRLEPLSAPQPEFKFGTLIFSNVLLLHKLLITGKGKQVVSRRAELDRDLLNKTCRYKNSYGITFSKVTALHLGINFNNSVAVARVLIKAGADVNALDSERWSPVHYATRFNPEVIPVLHDGGASVNLLDEKRLSALWYAARPSHINSSRSTVAALMAAGADPHLGRSPLTDCRIGKTMKAYIISLCDKCDKSNDSKDECKDYYFNEYDDLPLSTPQPVQGFMGHELIPIPYRYLGIFSNALLLHKLLVTGRGEQVVRRTSELNRRLVEHTCELNMNKTGGHYWTGDFVSKVTALHLAAYYSSPAVVKVLVKAGADVNARDSKKNSPLHWASSENSTVVSALLKAGAKMNLLNAHKHSPLFIAAKWNKNSTVAALLAAGADPLLGTSPLKDCDVDQNIKDYIKGLCKCGEDEDDESNQRKCKEEQENYDSYENDSWYYSDEDENVSFVVRRHERKTRKKEDKKDTNNKSGKKDSDEG